MPSSGLDKEEFVIALARGLEVIKVFSADRPELTLSEVAAATDLSPAVARRFLHTLVRLGYAAHDGKRFVLRPRVLELGAGYLGSMNLAEVAQPHLQEVRDRTGDSVSLTMLDDLDIIHILHVSTQRLMRFFVTSGTRVPAYVSSTGRVLLAHLDQHQLDERIARMELAPRTEKTVTTKVGFRKVIARVRQDGHAVVVDELDYGITSIGVPVFDNRTAVAAISCIAPTGYVSTGEFTATRLPELHEGAARITHELRRFPMLAHSVGKR